MGSILTALVLASLAAGAPRCVESLGEEPLGGPENARTTTDPEGGAPGWMLAAYLGGAHTRPSSLRISQPAVDTEVRFEDVHFEGRSLDSPLYYGLRVGFLLPRPRGVGIEAEFIHFKVYADPEQRVPASGRHRGLPIGDARRLGEIVQSYSVSHGMNLLLFNLSVRRQLTGGDAGGRPAVALTARAGAGPTFPHTESTIDGQSQEQYEPGKLAIQAAAGVELRMWRGLHALGEYKLTRTRLKGQVFSGHAESVLLTHHLVAGLGARF